MKDDKKVPQLRFPEFTDAWKQRELGEIAERVTRRNSSLESQTPLTISAEYGLIDQNKFFGKRIAAKDLSNYYLIQKGEFAYNKSTSNDAPWGAIKRLDCYNNGALSTLYIVFKIKDNKSCYSDFLVTYYGTSLWHKGVKEIASEGARNHGLLNVSPSDFFRTKLVIPQDFEEQRKIGAFFTQLDNTITLQQRKLNSLQKLKKGLLQKMFPKNGENIPEIRFPEFSDAWKQRKFGEFVERKSDSALSSTSIPSVEYENVESETGVLKKDIYVKTEFKKGVLFSDKDVLYGKLRPYLHNWLAPSFTGVAVGDWWVLSPKNCSKDFLYRLLQTLTFDEIANQTSGTKMPRADWNLVSSTAFYIPSSIEEQAKIGSLFNRIDSTITLQQRKLESLQKLKKGLLQQMFI